MSVKIYVGTVLPSFLFTIYKLSLLAQKITFISLTFFNSLHSGLYFFFPTVNVVLQLQKSAVPVETLVNSLRALSGIVNPRCQPTGL